MTGRGTQDEGRNGGTFSPIPIRNSPFAPRCLWVLGLMAIALSPLAAQSKVFVDIDRLLAAVPPPSPFAVRQSLPSLEIGGWAMTLQPTPFLAPAEKLSDIARWQREWEASLGQEYRLAATPPQLPFALRLAAPSSSPATESLSFLAERYQEQAFEWARINLRLTFADRLSPAERMKLQQRLKELDALWHPPPSPSPPPLPLPELPSPPPLPSPLTDADQIATLIAPPSMTPMTTTVSLSEQVTVGLPTSRVWRGAEGLRWASLRALAQAFARAYGKQRGWQVTFEPSPSALDKTSEVLTAWRQWWASESP